MAVSLASRLKEKFGEETFTALEQWVKGLIRSEGVSRDEYREIFSRLDLLDKGYTDLKEELYRLRSEVNDFRKEVNLRLDNLNARLISSIKWTVGTIALFGTIITVLMAIFRFTG